MNASRIKSLPLALAAAFALTACDVDEGEPSELRSLVNSHAGVELSHAELVQLTAQVPTAAESYATIEQYASASETAGDDYDYCIEDCNDAFYACEYDFFLACVYQEPSCGYEEVCEIMLDECLDDCETYHGTNGAGNGTGLAAVNDGGTGELSENEGGTGEPTTDETGGGTGEPTTDETGNGSGEPTTDETGNGSGEPTTDEASAGTGTP